MELLDSGGYRGRACVRGRIHEEGRTGCARAHHGVVVSEGFWVAGGFGCLAWEGLAVRSLSDAARAVESPGNSRKPTRSKGVISRQGHPVLGMHGRDFVGMCCLRDSATVEGG